MNRLEKKCLIASAAFHLSLVLTLALGTAFLVTEKKTEQILEMTFIPSKLVDEALFSGGTPNPAPARPPADARAVPPSAAPLQTPEQTPLPPKPKPQRSPAPRPAPANPETKPEPSKPADDLKSGAQPAKPKKPPRRVQPTYSETTANSDAARNRRDAAAAAALEQERALAAAAARWRNALSKIGQDLGQGLSSGVDLGPLGPGGEAFGNYRSAVFKIYYDAWRTPSGVGDDDTQVHARVLVARSGRVISHKILKASGIPALDKSVQETLERVTQLPSFPEASKDAERSFLLKFNLQAKRQLG